MQNRHQAEADAKLLLLQKTFAVSLDTNRFGGAERDRTADPLLAKQVLSQLSYRPAWFYRAKRLCLPQNGGPKWARTTDTRVINTVLYQLSYGPIIVTTSHRAIRVSTNYL